MLKIVSYRNKMIQSKNLKGLVRPANRQTGKPKSGQHLPQSLHKVLRGEPVASACLRAAYRSLCSCDSPHGFL